MANRALSPSPKLAIEQWVAEDVYIGDHEPLQVQHFYLVINVLLEHADIIPKEVFWSIASLLNLTVDIIFDSTNTYFEIDEPGPSDIKAFVKSKDTRGDLPQVTIDLKFTRRGISVRCCVLRATSTTANAWMGSKRI